MWRLRWWNQPTSRGYWSQMYVHLPISILTLHWPVSHLRTRISSCHLCGPSWMECDLCQISLSYTHLTTDIWSYRCGQRHSRCSMDMLYMPKNLWVDHSTRLWCVCNWTLFYPLQREIHLHKLKKTKNPNWIQTNYSSPLVASSNFLAVMLFQLRLSYVSWCFRNHWTYLIVINFMHMLITFRDFICLRWWCRRCWCTPLLIGITFIPYAASYPIIISSCTLL